MTTVYIGLGSNVGNSLGNIQSALRKLAERGCEVRQVASIIRTKPYGDVPQDDFYNTVCQIGTTLEPAMLLKVLKEVEKEVGRTPTVRWGPRVIDLDILLYDHLVYKTDELTIPHPDMLNRLFVLEPLAEIGSEIIHPITHRTIREELDLLNSQCKDER